MTKRKLLKYFKETPLDLRNLIFSYVSLMGEIYDKVKEREEKRLKTYRKSVRKQERYEEKALKSGKRIDELYRLKENYENYYKLKLKQEYAKLSKYDKLNENIAPTRREHYLKWSMASDEVDDCKRTERKLRKKYRAYNENYYAGILDGNCYVFTDSDSETDSESESE